MNWHALDIEETLRELGSEDRGLSAVEAKGRLNKFGPNELRKEDRVSPWSIFFSQFKNILIIILLVAIALSVMVGETVDAAIIGVIVVFSALLGFVQEYRAERALEALKEMLSATITVIRGGETQEIDAREIVPGDVIILESGDRVPADARIIESHSLRCDEAPLTGESMPVGKFTEKLPPDTSMADRKNMIFTGSVITYGRGRAVVTSTGMGTEFGKIAREVSMVRSEKTPLEKRTEEIGKWLGSVSLVICLIVIGVSLARELYDGTFNMQSAVTMLMFGVALAVAAVPEALTAIVTGALAIGMREMAKRNALVRRMPAVETLGCTTVICSDKTGTLTKGEMTVRKIYVDQRHIEVTGAGYDPNGEFRDESGPVPIGGGLQLLLKAGALCNDSSHYEKNGHWQIIGDPTEAALVVSAVKAGLRVRDLRESHKRVAEVPFSSERKMMTTVNVMPEGHMAFIKGAPEVLLSKATHIAAVGGRRPMAASDKAAIMKANEEMAKSALRVLAIACKPIGYDETDEDTIEKEITFIGLCGMMDPPRPEAVEAVAVCRRVHMKPVMITGDHMLTAVSVAKEMGIYAQGDMVLTGEELEAMNEAEFKAIVHKVSVYARVSPMDKLKIVKAWKDRGEVVAMTGDGVNDAPALKHADIGIAMGISGTEVAKEAADMVLSDDNFATIVSAIERGRWIYDNIKKYLTFLLRCNITEVLVIGGVVLALGPEYLPLLPAAILYVNLATDGLPALALGVSPADPDIMQRPPRNPNESVFSREVKLFILMAVLLEFPLFLYMFFSGYPDMQLVRTRMFFMFIILELVIAMNFRSMRFSVFKAPPHAWLVMAVFWELALAVALLQFDSVRNAFGIDFPVIKDIAVICGMAAAVFILMEAAKRFIAKTDNLTVRPGP